MNSPRVAALGSSVCSDDAEYNDNGLIMGARCQRLAQQALVLVRSIFYGAKAICREASNCIGTIERKRQLYSHKHRLTKIVLQQRLSLTSTAR